MKQLHASFLLLRKDLTSQFEFFREASHTSLDIFVNILFINQSLLYLRRVTLKIKRHNALDHKKKRGNPLLCTFINL